MRRIIGLDLGSKTVGVAQSDLLQSIASPLKTIVFTNDDYQQALNEVLKICDEQKVNEIVLGLPRHMNGDIGIRGQISVDFAESLQEYDIKVHMWDERLTTKAATSVLIEGNVRRNKRKDVVDQVAAVLILQGYLNSISKR